LVDPEELTRRWLQNCVLALDLCPFAAPVLRDRSLRIAVSEALDSRGQLQDFLFELDYLQQRSESEVSTTLLVLSRGPADFENFLGLLEAAQQLLLDAGLEGVVQLAHFHPAYRFAGEDLNDLSHFTNRSPLPVLHLLRESMMTRVLAAYPDPAEIPRRNMETLRELGREGVERLWASLRQP
jgi:hypothetical protein